VVIVPFQTFVDVFRGRIVECNARRAPCILLKSAAPSGSSRLHSSMNSSSRN